MFNVKSVSRIAVVLVAMTCAFGYTASAQLKIGYVRSEYIFSQYEPYQEAQRQLDEFHEEELDKLESKRQDLEQKAEEANKNAILMTEEMKQAKFEELQRQNAELETSYNQLYDPDSGRLSQKQRELLQPIINDINEVLNRVAQEEGYDFIFDAQASATLIYADEQYDISEMVIEELSQAVSTQ